MKQKELDHILTSDTSQNGEDNAYLTKTEVNLNNFPDNFPDNFPAFFPTQSGNYLENNIDKKSINQYHPKISLRFHLYNTKSATPILIYLRVDGTTYKHRSIFRVLPSDWNKETQLCNVTETQTNLTRYNNEVLNNVILRLRIWRNELMTYVCNQRSQFNRKLVENMFNKIINIMEKRDMKKENKKDYFDVIRALRKQADKGNTSTAKEYYQRIAKIEKYIKGKKLSDNLYDINYTFVFNFKEYLNTSDISYGRCKDILRMFKSLIKEIGNDPNYKYEYDPKIENLEIDKNKEKRSLSDKQETQIVLSDEQIDALKTLELSGDNEKQVRDLFLLQCYTACRHSDLSKLLDKNNLITIDKKEYVRFMDKKEGKRKSKLSYVNAPLFLYADVRGLWEKLTSNPIIINIADTKSFNYILKRIAKKSNAFNDTAKYINARGKEVTKHLYDIISSHSGRHTFITKWSKVLSPQEIIYFTGHANTECIENNYLHRTENVIDGQLERISNKLMPANNMFQNVEVQNVTTIQSIDQSNIINEIRTLKDELTSPKLKELEEYKELFPEYEWLDRIADKALYDDIENIRRDFEEENL